MSNKARGFFEERPLPKFEVDALLLRWKRLPGHHNLCEVIHGLDEIELSFMRVVVGRNIRIADIDLRVDLFVEELVLGL